MPYPDPKYYHTLGGFEVMVDDAIGHIAVTHDGTITWDELQAIKSSNWGPDSRAIEVYPSEKDIVNNATVRHLWRLGADDFVPDLLGRAREKDTLETRFHTAWKTATTQ